MNGFSHNAFALELVNRIEQRHTSYPGLNLTHEVLEGQQFRSDKNSGTVPMLEIQVVDACDSIAYDAHDLDDALKLGLLHWNQLQGLGLVQRGMRFTSLDQGNTAHRRQILVHSLIDLQMGDFIQHAMLQLADATELETMALPNSDTSSIVLKEESLLQNFHQRFKKDFIYVSVVFLSF